jgi:hypothetical protein
MPRCSSWKLSCALWFERGSRSPLRTSGRGGGAISVFGYQLTIYINALTFFVSASAILLLKLPSTGEQVQKAARRLAGVYDEVREAIVHISKRDRTLLAGSLMFTGTNFAIWPIGTWGCSRIRSTMPAS